MSCDVNFGSLWGFAKPGGGWWLGTYFVFALNKEFSYFRSRSPRTQGRLSLAVVPAVAAALRRPSPAIQRPLRGHEDFHEQRIALRRVVRMARGTIAPLRQSRPKFRPTQTKNNIFHAAKMVSFMLQMLDELLTGQALSAPSRLISAKNSMKSPGRTGLAFMKYCFVS